MVHGINVGDHKKLLNTKYITCRPHSFRNFKKFSCNESMEVNEDRVWPIRTQGAWLAGLT